MKNNSNYSKEYCPSKTECFEIIREYGTPTHVQSHCNAVGETAKAIAKELNNKGLKINVDLVSSAGYLHDVARVHKKHELVGAQYLKSKGLIDVSEVIKDHTKHKINTEIQRLNEEDVLCIADRVVLENKFVGPQKRMEYIKSKAIKKYGQESEGALDWMIYEFVSFINELEIFIGKKIYDIIPGNIR